MIYIKNIAYAATLGVSLPLCYVRPASSGAVSQHSGGLVGESSFGVLAAEADTMEDKLKLVETKRR